MSEKVVHEMTVEEMIEQNKTYLGFIESRYKEMQKRCEKLNERSEYIELNSYGEGIKKGEQLMQQKVDEMLEFREHTKWEIIEDIFGTKTALVDFISNINEYYNKIINYEKEKEEKEKEIRVGDEVLYEDGNKYVVYCLTYGYIYALKYDGTGGVFKRSDISKTGKHYCLDEILKELE